MSVVMAIWILCAIIVAQIFIIVKRTPAHTIPRVHVLIRRRVYDDYTHSDAVVNVLSDRDEAEADAAHSSKVYNWPSTDGQRMVTRDVYSVETWIVR